MFPNPFREVMGTPTPAQSHVPSVINEIISGRGQHHLNNMSNQEIHALMARLEEEAYHRLGVLVGKLED